MGIVRALTPSHGVGWTTYLAAGSVDTRKDKVATGYCSQIDAVASGGTYRESSCQHKITAIRPSNLASWQAIGYK